MEYVNALAKFSGEHSISYRTKGAEADQEVSAANILIGACGAAGGVVQHMRTGMDGLL